MQMVLKGRKETPVPELIPDDYLQYSLYWKLCVAGGSTGRYLLTVRTVHNHLDVHKACLE